MRINLLGPLQLCADTGTPVEVGGARLRRLLIRLALEPGRTVTVGRLSDALWEGEPPARAANALQALVSRLRRAGLVDSVRGAKGGYHLAKEPSVITVRDIMSASEHQTFEMNCENHQVEAERCNPASACSIRPVWQALQQRVDDLLSSISIADLMKQESQVVELVGISSSS